MTSDELYKLWCLLRRYRNAHLANRPEHRQAALALLDMISMDLSWHEGESARRRETIAGFSKENA
jgi:hypothetical protein